jgi:hypothetical protein
METWKDLMVWLARGSFSVKVFGTHELVVKP